MLVTDHFFRCPLLRDALYYRWFSSFLFHIVIRNFIFDLHVTVTFSFEGNFTSIPTYEEIIFIFRIYGPTSVGLQF